jgi:hypothetical protein
LDSGLISSSSAALLKVRKNSPKFPSFGRFVLSKLIHFVVIVELVDWSGPYVSVRDLYALTGSFLCSLVICFLSPSESSLSNV